VNIKDTTYFRKKFFALVQDSENIMITSHKRPDDDSIASVLSVFTIIKEQYPEKNVRMLYTGSFSNRWNYFENFELVESVDDIANIINEFDLSIFLDSSPFGLFSEFPEKVESYKGKMVCIDHHKNTPPDRYDLLYHDSDAISNAGLIYKVFLQEEETISTPLAETVLMGVLGDSGTFKFLRPEHGEIFDMAKRLLEDNKIDIQALKAKYEKFSAKVLELIQVLMQNIRFIETEGWPKCLCSYLDNNSVDSDKYTKLEISEAAHIFIQMFGLSIENINWSFVIYPGENDYKVSMRSLPGSVNVRMFAQDMGLGGGHDRAAGITLKTDLNLKTIDQIFEYISGWMQNNQAKF
jgi:bifunctional oligoribonuclease and PAP phosphatase NrnA